MIIVFLGVGAFPGASVLSLCSFVILGYDGQALKQKTQDNMREAADRPWVDVCLALALTQTMDQSKLQLH